MKSPSRRFRAIAHPALPPLDVQEACAAVDRLLRTWVLRVAVPCTADGDSAPHLAGGFLLSPRSGRPIEQSGSDYFLLSEYEYNRQKAAADAAPPKKAPEAYFTNPVHVWFDPREAVLRDDSKLEDGIAFSAVWSDLLARTLWLAIKSRHITNQYFRRACLTQAEDIRRRPPRTTDDLHISVDIHHFNGGLDADFRAQIYPYIVRVLIDEKRWPYFEPQHVSSHRLGWIFVDEYAVYRGMAVSGN